jgi:hypothetical protein
LPAKIVEGSGITWTQDVSSGALSAVPALGKTVVLVRKAQTAELPPNRPPVRFLLRAGKYAAWILK